MSYSEYTNPRGSGYKDAAHPRGNYSASSSKEGVFLELSPYKNYEETIEGGVGQFHVNHFIGYFIPPSKKPSTAEFFSYFPFIFTEKGNVASAVTADYYEFKGKATVKFKHANPLKAYFHEDWVSLQMAPDKASFFARTLKREWAYPQETAAAVLAKLTLNIDLPLDVNQRHFLSGRRSWAVGYLPASKLCYVETAAFERFSHAFYDQHQWLLSIGAAVIVDIWTKLIKDYADFYKRELVTNDGIMQIFSEYKKGYTYFSQPSGGTPVGNLQILPNIYYAQAERSTAAEAHAIPWFKEVLKRHPGLLQ